LRQVDAKPKEGRPVGGRREAAQVAQVSAPDASVIPRWLSPDAEQQPPSAEEQSGGKKKLNAC
jgi:hypothetical protein